MSATASPRLLRIGEVAERTGVTPRTIRYYEEIGLLPAFKRRKGEHRLYDDADVERLQELTRLRDLLNLSLDELKQLVEAEEARAAIRRRLQATDSDAERLKLLDEALPHVETQLELVRRRLGELQNLEAELVAKRKRILERRKELSS
jgi:MerR family transcriptional regulator, repressor of the yfmOP operon